MVAEWQRHRRATDDITSDTAIAVQEGTTGQDYAEKKTDAQVQS